MKKKVLSVLLALVLVLSFSLIPVIPALAWDEEDSLVASYDDFIWGIGWDDDSMESYYGEQSWSYYETPSDGYNLYRDDVSGTGNLDEIRDLITRTPEAIDLPEATTTYFDSDGGLWYMRSESPDTYYWATEPRGYNLPSTKADVLKDSGVPGKGLDKAPGLQKPFNPNSQAGNNAGKK